VQARGNLFSMLGLDPFKDLDPAIREITQTRELAERSIYYMQRLPTLLDMQVELLTYQLAVMPETRQVLSDVDRVSVIGSASDRVARTLPELLDKQREALVAQLLRLLNVESSNLGSLAGELRATLDAGTGTANALHGALQSVEHITTAFAPQPGAPPPKEPRSPFDIRQYTEMLKQATITAQQLEALTQRADAALPVVRSLTAEAASRLDQVLDRLFILLLLLVFAAAAAVLLAALAYRRIVARFARSDVVAARGG
jgi:hypothetical protein